MVQSRRRVAIVTGATRGIGAAVAIALARAGDAVAIVGRSAETASEAARELSRAENVPALGVAADVADAESCRRAYARIVEELGPVQVLVNNAGIMPQQKGRIEQLPPEDFEQMMAIHVGGTLNFSRLVMPEMRKAKFGRIINVASANAMLVVPYRVGYITAKKAILGMTEAHALECARAGITVNAIVPGYILTETLRKRAEAGILDEARIAERTPVGRWGRPEEIGDAVRFLADPASSFITGATLVVDGGYTIRGDPGEDLDASPYRRS